MKITALITTLILGSSSIAMARPIAAPAPQPAPTYHHAPVYQPVPKPQFMPPSRHRWVTLGSVNQVADGQMTFRVGKLAAQFSTLKLQSQGGKSFISRVLIQFANGRTQVVELNQYLNANNPALTIDLEGRQRSIAKITVVGRNARRSAYSVLAG